MTAVITESHFSSDGTYCAGTLYLPAGIDRPPVVVMGHGLGAQQDFRLPAFAERFVERGLSQVPAADTASAVRGIGPGYMLKIHAVGCD